MSDDTQPHELYTIHPYATTPEIPRERLDMSRCVSYARGKSENECVAEFKAKYGIEPQFVMQRKDYGYTLGMTPKDWVEGSVEEAKMDELLCPWCGGDAECEMTDNGVGMQQTSPYRCTRCGAEQFNLYIDDISDCDEEERRVGWRRGLPLDENSSDGAEDA